MEEHSSFRNKSINNAKLKNIMTNMLVRNLSLRTVLATLLTVRIEVKDVIYLSHLLHFNFVLDYHCIYTI